MYIAAHHTVHDPDEFWRCIQGEDPLEGAIRPIKIIRNEVGDRAAILWEAETIEALQAWLRERLGHVSEEECKEAHSLSEWGL